MPALMLGRERGGGGGSLTSVRAGVLKPQSSLEFLFVNVSSLLIFSKFFINLSVKVHTYRQNGGKRSCPGITQVRAGVANQATRHLSRNHGPRRLRHHLPLLRRRRLDSIHRTSPVPLPFPPFPHLSTNLPLHSSSPYPTLPNPY